MNRLLSVLLPNAMQMKKYSIWRSGQYVNHFLLVPSLLQNTFCTTGLLLFCWGWLTNNMFKNDWRFFWSGCERKSVIWLAPWSCLWSDILLTLYSYFSRRWFCLCADILLTLYSYFSLRWSCLCAGTLPTLYSLFPLRWCSLCAACIGLALSLNWPAGLDLNLSGLDIGKTCIIGWGNNSKPQNNVQDKRLVNIVLNVQERYDTNGFVMFWLWH